MKKLIELKLKILAKMILAKYKPEIIGITGSVGKTSTKEAIYTVLSAKFNVRRSRENYNNEIGVPLTIINADSPGKNIFGWYRVFFKALGLVLFRDINYPKILVLEMGVDRPGDMDYLNSIVKCRIGVVTFLSSVHLKFFSSLAKLHQEKAKLIKNIPKTGWSIINYDNEATRKITKDSRAKVLSFGLEEKADVRAQEIIFSFENSLKAKVTNLKGISFKLSYQGSFAPVLLPGVLGISSVYTALAAAAVGIVKEMNILKISEALRKFKPPKGRMNVIPGIKYTTIIDDTYNSEPKSAIAALGTLKRIPVEKGARKFAVLGDMLELGSYSEAGHREVGKYAAKCKVDKLIVVGERARDISRGAREAGMSGDYIFDFPDSVTAGKFVQDRIRQGDLILIKGSQGIRMEKIVLEIMAEPLRAKELLVRQEERWLKK